MFVFGLEFQVCIECDEQLIFSAILITSLPEFIFIGRAFLEFGGSFARLGGLMFSASEGAEPSASAE